VVGGTTVG